MKRMAYSGRGALLAVLIFVLIVFVGCDSGLSEPEPPVPAVSPTQESNPHDEIPDLPSEIPQPTDSLSEIPQDKANDDNIFLPDLLGFGPGIFSEHELWITYDELPEFAALWDMFISETGLQTLMEQIEIQIVWTILFVYEPDSLWIESYIPDDYDLFVSKYYPYHMYSKLSGARYYATRPVGERMEKITVGSSRVENLFNKGETVVMVGVEVVVLNDIGFPFPVAWVDVTGSHIIWDTFAITRLFELTGVYD